MPSVMEHVSRSVRCEAMERERWTGAIAGLILLAIGGGWYLLGAYSAAQFQRTHPGGFYDEMATPVLTFVFSWLGLVVLGGSLVRKRRIAWRILGGLCLALAVLPLVFALWIVATD